MSYFRLLLVLKNGCLSLTGRIEPDNDNHFVSTDVTDESSNKMMLSGRMDCCRRVSVDAADARKDEGASMCALRIPSPPFLTVTMRLGAAGRHSSVRWGSWIDLFKAYFQIRPATDYRCSLPVWAGISACQAVLPQTQSVMRWYVAETTEPRLQTLLFHVHGILSVGQSSVSFLSPNAQAIHISSWM